MPLRAPMILVVLVACLGGCAQTEPGAALPVFSSPALNPSAEITRIAFGSCAKPENDQRMFDTILSRDPDVFLFIGDNVYAPNDLDPSLAGLRAQYQLLGESAPFARLRERVPLLVTWDDHDFGPNDAGGDFAYKWKSQDIFNTVWDVAAGDPRSARDGVYFSKTVGPAGRRVQFILLDTRFFRTELAPGSPGSGDRYGQQMRPGASMLGETQWRWLEAQLSTPADLRILASSIQVLADGHGFEAWRTMPIERQRLFEVIRKTGADKLILLSGDRHSASFYRRDDLVEYPLLELTSSSLNHPLSNFVPNIVTEPGPHRLHEPYHEANFGEIEIDWEAGELSLSIRGADGGVVRALKVPLAALGRR